MRELSNRYQRAADGEDVTFEYTAELITRAYLSNIWPNYHRAVSIARSYFVAVILETARLYRKKKRGFIFEGLELEYSSSKFEFDQFQTRYEITPHQKCK